MLHDQADLQRILARRLVKQIAEELAKPASTRDFARLHRIRRIAEDSRSLEVFDSWYAEAEEIAQRFDLDEAAAEREAEFEAELEYETEESRKEGIEAGFADAIEQASAQVKKAVEDFDAPPAVKLSKRLLVVLEGLEPTGSK